MDTEYLTDTSAAKEAKTEFMKRKTRTYFLVEVYDFTNGIWVLFSAFELPQRDLVIATTSQYLRKSVYAICR